MAKRDGKAEQRKEKKIWKSIRIPLLERSHFGKSRRRGREHRTTGRTGRRGGGGGTPLATRARYLDQVGP